MSLFERLFRRRINRILEEKASQVQALLSVGGGGAVWADQDFENFAKESYLKNVISYRCIDLIAKSVSSVPWKLFKDVGYGEREEVNEHPVSGLLKRANPQDSFSYLMLANTAYLVMNGNCYFERVRMSAGDGSRYPKELYALRPDRVSIQINDNTGQKTGYKYSVSGRNHVFQVDLATGESDVLHIRNFHPINDFYGAGATQPTAREIDTSNEMTEWNKSMLQNEARPGMLFSVKGFLTDQQYERLKGQIKANYEGSKNTARTLLLEGEGGVDAKPYSWSPKEIDYIPGGQELARRIAVGYGVPSMLLGIPGDNTYSNYQEARLSFWEETVFYYLRYFKDELNNWLFQDGEDLFIDFMLDDVPALAPRRQELWKRAEETDFITLNEKRGMVEMPALGPEADVVLVQASMIPLGKEPDMDETVPEEEEEAEEENPEEEQEADEGAGED